MFERYSMDITIKEAGRDIPILYYIDQQKELDKVRKCHTIDEMYGFVEPVLIDLSVAKAELKPHQYNMLMQYIRRGHFQAQSYIDLPQDKSELGIYEGDLEFYYGGHDRKSTEVIIYNDEGQVEFYLSDEELEKLLTKEWVKEVA